MKNITFTFDLEDHRAEKMENTIELSQIVIKY